MKPSSGYELGPNDVDSEEKDKGTDIEVDEEALPSRAAAIHEEIRQDGEKELERDGMALLWSAIAAGLSMSASLMAKGIFKVHLDGVPGAFLLENLGYTFGFVIVIMARQHFFTENTVTAVLPVMHKPTWGNGGLLLRLWGIVLLGNLIGTALGALAFNEMPIFDEATRHQHESDGELARLNVCQRRHFRLDYRHHGLDVPLCGRGQTGGHCHDDLAGCAGRSGAYRGGIGGGALSGLQWQHQLA